MASEIENHNPKNGHEDQHPNSNATEMMIARSTDLDFQSKEESDSDGVKTKPTKRRPTKVELNDTLRRMRQLITEGYNNVEIQDTLQLDERTFYRYMNRIHKMDQAIFEEQGKDAVATQIQAFNDRLLRGYRWLVAITENEKMHPRIRMEAQRGALDVAWALIKLKLEGPRFLQMQGLLNKQQQQQQQQQQDNHLNFSHIKD